jgi:hypothetical protein
VIKYRALLAAGTFIAGLTVSNGMAQDIAVKAGSIAVQEASSTVPSQPRIKVLPATQLPSATVGVLSDAEGGFGPTLWHASQAVRMRQLYEGMPADVQSPVLRDIIRRLLLTPTSLPADAAADPSIAQTVQQVRLNRLVAMEAYDGLERLLPAIPKNGRDGYWFEAHFRTFLYQQEFERACGVVDTAAALQDVFWQQARLFCQGVRKDFDGALRTVSLMREQGQAVPEWLQRLVIGMAADAASENAAEPVEGAEPSVAVTKQRMVFPQLGAVEMAMLAAWPASDDDTVQAASLTPEAGKLYSLMATHPNLPWETRLDAAELALMTGHFDKLAVEALYNQVPFSEAELSIKPGEQADKSAMRRAQWFRTLKRLYTVDDSVAAMSSVFAQYREQELMRAGSALYADTVRDLSRAIFRKHQFSAFAGDAFAVLFASRYFSDAQLWLDAAAMGEKKAVQAVPVWKALLEAMAPLADASEKTVPGTLAIDLDGYKQEPFWARGGLMLEALGYTLAPNYWQVVPKTSAQALSLQGTMIRQASAAGKRGEVLVLAIQMAGSKTRLSDGDVTAMLEALVKHGFRREALLMTHELLVQELMGAGWPEKMAITAIAGQKHPVPEVVPAPAPVAPPTAAEEVTPVMEAEQPANKKPRKKVKKKPAPAPVQTAPQKASVPDISLPSADVAPASKR